MVNNSLFTRELSSCFYLVIPCCDDESEFKDLLQQAMQVERATAQMMKGEISPDDFLDIVEPGVPIDQYLDEVEENLEPLICL